MFDHLDEFFENFASIVLPTYSFISLLKYLLKFKAFKLKKQTKNQNSVNIACYWILNLFLAAPLPWL